MMELLLIFFDSYIEYCAINVHTKGQLRGSTGRCLLAFGGDGDGYRMQRVGDHDSNLSRVSVSGLSWIVAGQHYVSASNDRIPT